MSEDPRRPGLEELARQLVEAIPQNLKALSEDMERNFKALLQSGLERMDLVTREEFDLQAAVLERTREKLEALEIRLAELEQRQAGGGPAASAAEPDEGRPIV